MVKGVQEELPDWKQFENLEIIEVTSNKGQSIRQLNFSPEVFPNLKTIRFQSFTTLQNLPYRYFVQFRDWLVPEVFGLKIDFKIDKQIIEQYYIKTESLDFEIVEPQVFIYDVENFH